MPRTEAANQHIRDQRRAHIVATAAELFMRQGVAAVKMSDLAAAAEMSQGLCYRYFASKEAVFLAVVEQFLDELTQVITTGRATPGQPRERIRALTELLLTIVQAHPGRHQLILAALAQPQLGQAQVETALLGLRLQLLPLIEAGQAAGEIGPANPQQLVSMYFALALGLAATINAGLPDWAAHLPDADVIMRMFH